MTIKQLEYFMEVARRLNFSLAAKALFISQPALSRSISSLEEELGVILLFRNKHNVALTPAGMVLATSVPKLKADLDRTVVLVQQAREGMSGKLAMGLQSGFVAPEVLSSAISYIHESLPFIEISPTCYELGELSNALNYGHSDIIYTCDMKSAPEDGIGRIVLERVPLCYAYVPDGISESFSPQGKTFAFTGGTSSALPESWRGFCRARGFTPKIVPAKDTATLLFLIENGYCVGVLPKNHRVFLGGVKQLEVGEDYCAEGALLWNKANLNSCVEVFIKLIRGDI